MEEDTIRLVRRTRGRGKRVMVVLLVGGGEREKRQLKVI